MKQHLTKTILAFGTTLAASVAAGATLDISQQGSHIYFDSNDANPLFARTEFLVGTQAVADITAGAFRLTGTDINGIATDFIAFCLQPLEGIDLSPPHEMASRFSTAINDRLNTLAENAFQLVNSHETAAAFQMAAWEITTELTGNAYDIDTGFFQITSDLDISNAAEGIAQGWLENIESGTWGPPTSTFMFLNAEGTQDLITDVQTSGVSAVPLPASGLMLLTTLFGAGGLMTRRKRKKDGTHGTLCVWPLTGRDCGEAK